jgi:bifunctional non-homologous end joining protein LigD
MSLGQYQKKRKFNDTPEPKGTVEAGNKELSFVIQRHEASHLHYDFRLELDGTLKSWAVPKGPSLNPKDKRLAVMVEDHPLSYAGFEGDIPPENHGAGHVAIWDKGSYEPVDAKGGKISATQFSKALEKGSLRFNLHGSKMKGIFYLRRLGTEEKNWLLIKSHDEHATEEPYDAESQSMDLNFRAESQILSSCSAKPSVDIIEPLGDYLPSPLI